MSPVLHGCFGAVVGSTSNNELKNEKKIKKTNKLASVYNEPLLTQFAQICR